MKKKGGRYPVPPAKRCKRCRLFKPNTTEFYKNPNRSKICLMCIKLKRVEWYIEHREYVLQRNRDNWNKRTLLRRMNAVPSGYIMAKIAADRYGYSHSHVKRLAHAKKIKGRVILDKLYIQEESIRRYAKRPSPPLVCKYCGESDTTKLKSAGHNRLCRICKTCDAQRSKARRHEQRQSA